MTILQTALTSVLSMAVLFIIAKCIGHRQISELDVFDYVTGITIGSIAAELATEIENPEKPLTAMVVYGVLTVIINIIADKSDGCRRFVNGKPSILIENGKLSRNAMKKSHLNLNEFLMMCRESGYFDLSQIETAVFETNGSISFQLKPAYNPATHNDLGAPVQPNTKFTELIMDGRVLYGNLKKLGFDEKWLASQTAKLGRNEFAKIFLCLCDDKGNVSIY